MTRPRPLIESDAGVRPKAPDSRPDYRQSSGQSIMVGRKGREKRRPRCRAVPSGAGGKMAEETQAPGGGGGGEGNKQW